VLDRVQVDVCGVAARQGQLAAIVRGGFPGDGLVDVQAVEQLAGVVVKCGPQRCGHRVGELVIPGQVQAGMKRQLVAGVVQVGSGEQLVEVPAGVQQSAALPSAPGPTWVRASPPAQVLPLGFADDFGGYEVTAPLVVDGTAMGVEVGGEISDRGQHRFAAVGDKWQEHAPNGEPATVGVQVRVRLAGLGRVSRQQQACGDTGAEWVGPEPFRWHQPDSPARPQRLRQVPRSCRQQPRVVAWQGRKRGAGSVPDPLDGWQARVQGAQEPALGRAR
jgi:hypothetical protein